METCYFFPEDYKYLEKLIAEARRRTDSVHSGMGEAYSRDGDGWHDNPAYASAVEQSAMFSRQARDLRNVLSSSQVVLELPPDDGRVRLGKLVTFENLDTGDVSTVFIGSYMIDPARKRGDGHAIISYVSPLGRLLRGAKVGEVRQGALPSSGTSLLTQRVQVKSISIPSS